MFLVFLVSRPGRVFTKRFFGPGEALKTGWTGPAEFGDSPLWWHSFAPMFTLSACLSACLPAYVVSRWNGRLEDEVTDRCVSVSSDMTEII